jgi:hypothetical protein
MLLLTPNWVIRNADVVYGLGLAVGAVMEKIYAGHVCSLLYRLLIAILQLQYHIRNLIATTQFHKGGSYGGQKRI